MIKWVVFIINLIVIVPCSGFAIASIKSNEIRYIFDIGSSTSKVYKYNVNLDNGTASLIYHTKVPYSYQSCIKQSDFRKKHTIPQLCLQKGIDAILNLQDKNNINCHQEKCGAIVTAWARNLDNIQDWCNMMAKDAGIQAQVLTQEEEGYIAQEKVYNFYIDKNIKLENIVGLDIGGGSFQIMFQDIKGEELLIHPGKYGTDKTTQILAKHFNHPSIHDHHPMNINKSVITYSKDDFPQVLEFIHRLIRKSINRDLNLKRRLNKNNGSIHLVGHGTFFNAGLQQQLNLNKSTISITEILSLSKSFCGKNKEEIKKAYPVLPESFYFSSQTSIMLLYGIMSNLGVHQIHITPNSDFAHLASSYRYWQN